MSEFVQKQQTILRRLGRGLKQLRLERNDSQAVFAERLGVSRLTCIKMEQGHPAVAIKHWINASILLGQEQAWESLFHKETSLFEQFDQLQTPVRQRTRSRRK
ncbi:hypothetical protein MNBD_GAMMA26-674 [hydrothermal vent metagenome]|uniref:HTH cro/C1-type domain-containing protein n=1 Tax=hydrothermal vent metagenome TaxID=652676 RepID=A0A3B1AH96_9ZZZZ